jgi:drug/metabolite transporter (DMT)-like permease
MALINRLMERHEAAQPGVPAEAAPIAGACFYLAVRFTAALALLAVLLPGVCRGLTRRQWLLGMAVGLPFTVGMVLQFLALNEIPPSRSGFLTSLAVVFTPMLVVVLRRRLPGEHVLVGVWLALLGTAVLTGACEVGWPIIVRPSADLWSKIGTGDWLTIIAAFLFAVQILLIDAFSRVLPPETLTPGMFVAVIAGAALVWAGVASWDGVPQLAVRANELADPGFLFLTLLTSLLCTVVAFYLMNKYQAHLSPAHAALLYTLEPICATLWAMLLPDLLSLWLGLDYPSERPGLGLVIGGGLVLLANVAALWPARAPAAACPDTPRPREAYSEGPA